MSEMKISLRDRFGSSVVPDRWKVLSGSSLKLIAVLCMLVDHIAGTFLVKHPILLLSIAQKELTQYALMRSIG